MSGDVQPRKRKDKKKKKDEEINDDIHIHVHKDGGTGGNICSKIVFFFLFSALIFLIGLIIKENQGLNELENMEEQSRFSQVFEGWIEEKSRAEHNDKDGHIPELDHHDDDLTEEDDEDDGYGSEGDVHLDNETEEVEESREAEEDEDEEADLEEDGESKAKSEEEETVEESEEENDELDSEEDQEAEEITEEIAEDNSGAIQNSEEDENKKETEPESKEDDRHVEESEEDKEKLELEEEDEVLAEQKLEIEKQIRKREVEKEISVKDNEKEQPPIEDKEHLTMATKIGVGIALLTVAYNVFVRKRQSDLPITRAVEDKERTADLSRRNTIVPPLSLQEIEPDLPEVEPDEEEYSGDEEYSDDDKVSEHRSSRDEYQELRNTYSRSLSPEGDCKVKSKNLEQTVLQGEMEELEREEELEEEEEVEEESDQYDDDEELLKRLELKYGRLGREVNVGDDYEHSNITNKDDYNIRTDIKAATEQLHKNPAYANKLFDMLLEKYSLSPRLLYGKAVALDILAEEHQSNDILNKALRFYSKALDVPNIPDTLFVLIAERYINRARFIGQYKKAIRAHWKLIERFPKNATYLNSLAVTYLTVNMLEEARSLLKKVLAKWPEDGFALVHYGFILKIADNNLEESVKYLDKGLKTKATGVIDGRFFLYLGDSLLRLSRIEEANKIHEEGVRQNVFLSKYQRSLYNIPRLRARPWWQPEDLPTYQNLFTTLKDNWKKIRSEGLSALSQKGFYEEEAENLKDKGTWKQLELFARGHKSKKNCEKAPITCGIVFSEATSCKRGQTKFSVMHPNTHVWPHCGPTNCRLRIHLGLKVPPGTFIRVGEKTRSWKEGDIIIFDDSFEHEVWHNGTEFRLVLIVDVWHPGLTLTEKKTLTSI